MSVTKEISINKELVINSSNSGVEIALLEDKSLVELHSEKNNSQHTVGDIYLGKVKKLMPGLNAAFIDVGYEKDAFLHYLDLGQQFSSLTKYTRIAMTGDPNSLKLESLKLERDIEKNGKINEVIKIGQFVLVQIAKEPISTKGPKVTCDLSFAGRYIVLVPFSNRVSISQKIKSIEERNRLKRLINSIRPNNFGIIVRTVADSKSVADLDADLHSLLDKWNSIKEKLITTQNPERIYSELGKTSALLRDLLTDDFNSIYVNNADMYSELKTFVHTIAPEKTDIVKHYKLQTPIFEQFGIAKQIRNSFGKVVTIRSGIYLIIEHTEALHVIDVNSGNHPKSGKGQEDTSTSVNIEAAIEIARQLRLRDMGGIIVIDFIDMYLAENRKALYQKLVEEMSKDKAKHTILPPSKFGLVQITRQRVRPAIDVEMAEHCPVCHGTGTIQSSMSIIDELDANIKYLFNVQKEESLSIIVHPFVYSFLTKGIKSHRVKWFLLYKKWIKLSVSSKFHFFQYEFLNKNGETISM